jgi:outer membrane protein insertion porin family
MKLALALLLAAPAALAQLRLTDPTERASEEPAAEPAPSVTEIRITGNRRVEGDAIRAALKTRPGMPFDRARIAGDIRALWALGFFQDIEVSAEPTESGLLVIYRVEERPAIRSITYRGNSEIGEEDLKQLVDIKLYSILDADALRRNLGKLKDKYQEKGFYLAEVTYELKPMPDNEVELVFVVEEHAKVEIKKITFIGNKHVPAEVISEGMATREGNVFSFLSGWGTYKEEMIQRDLLWIAGVYYDRGFINVRVGKPEIQLSADKREIYITIPIEEGEPYDLGKVGVSGDLLEEKEKMEARLVVKQGERFSRTRLQTDLLALSDQYRDQGYAYVNVTPLTAVDVKKKTVDLTFDIQKGDKITIERIEIAGNDKTRDKVIRREMRVYEGELYSGTGIKVSRQRVFALGFFESADITTRTGGRPDTMIVTVTVKEKSTGTFQLGFGFSSAESLIGTAQIAQNNLFGWGVTGSFSGQWSGLRRLFQLSYLDPYFLDTPWTFAFDAYRTELNYERFDRAAVGGSLTFGYEFFEDFRLFSTYTLEFVDVTPGRGAGELLIADRFQSGRTSSLRLSANYDKRDNRLFPSRGFLQSASVEFAPGFLASENQFARYRAVSRWYFPLPFGLVLKFNGELGFMQSLDPSRPVPISELFFMGGVNSVRGYPLQSIAPTRKVGASADPASPLIDFATGGNKMALFQAEVEFPLLEQAGIRGVVFYDAGNSYGEDEFFFQDKQDAVPLGLFHSFGFGFRWFSPIGPLRFEWGIPLNKRLSDRDIQFEFTIGNPF